ncbi:MAG TPA: heme-binding protein [Anaerolineales bacterium]|nr:heme-binding protein [Anaerolineales bacterium]
MLLADAEQALNAARAKAKEMGVAMAIAVVNESGFLTAFIRMDNSELVAIPLAEDKAYTALVNRLSTLELGQQCQPGGPLYGLQANLGGRMVIFPGGIPIWRDGILIGAVGASGGAVEQDHACALAGVLALGKSSRS